MKSLCSLCKAELKPTDNEGEFVCPLCAAVYYPDKEIIEQESGEFGSSHSDEIPEITGAGSVGPSLIAADDDTDPSITDMLYKSPKHKPNQGEGAQTWD